MVNVANGRPRPHGLTSSSFPRTGNHKRIRDSALHQRVRQTLRRIGQTSSRTRVPRRRILNCRHGLLPMGLETHSAPDRFKCVRQCQSMVRTDNRTSSNREGFRSWRCGQSHRRQVAALTPICAPHIRPKRLACDSIRGWIVLHLESLLCVTGAYRSLSTLVKCDKQSTSSPTPKAMRFV